MECFKTVCNVTTILSLPFPRNASLSDYIGGLHDYVFLLVERLFAVCGVFVVKNAVFYYPHPLWTTININKNSSLTVRLSRNPVKRHFPYINRRMQAVGLEPTSLSRHAPKACAYTSSATPA